MAAAWACFPCAPPLKTERRPAESDVVTLDVGGKVYKTLRKTLCSGRASKSYLHELVSTEACDVYFIDRSGDVFETVLNWLREGDESLPKMDLQGLEGVCREAKFFSLPALEAVLQERMKDLKSRERDSLTAGTINLSTGNAADVGKLQPPFSDLQVLKLIGQGSFGSVYYSSWCGTEVACKVIQTIIRDGTSLKVSKQDFEAELSASISHPNLVQTYKYGEQDLCNEVEDEEGGITIHETWILQEWCAGGTLRDRCKQPRLRESDQRDVADICVEISRAGSYLHDIRIIHGDLTPSNVLTKKDKNSHKGFICKVCDFGLARVLSAENQEIFTQTMGTVTHMPPELFSSEPAECKLTQKADIYAFGMIMYFVISAAMPWKKMSTAQVVVSVSKGGKLHLPEGCDAQLVQVYKRCTEFSPSQRPSFADIVKEMSQILNRLKKGAAKAAQSQE